MTPSDTRYAGRGTHKAQAHLHGLMVLSLFHKITAPGLLLFFFAALLGGGRSPLTHFSDYASLMSLFSQAQLANAVFCPLLSRFLSLASFRARLSHYETETQVYGVCMRVGIITL